MSSKAQSKKRGVPRRVTDDDIPMSSEVQKEYVDKLPADDESSTFAPVMKYGLLGLICLLSFAIRLFAVVRYESVIHEFDPYFNFRTTKYLAQEGFLEFLNWFDDRAWYPLGRIIGGTIYPGLMLTAASVYWVLNAINITINIRNMCVFLAPLFAANTAVASYLFTKEFSGRSSTALLAAAFTGIVPSYISRSVGGSYDNEGVAIFALIFTFYLWIKAVNTGSMLWAAGCALVYFYMVAAWGGYVFIINIIPIYVVIMLVAGRASSRLYIAYSTFYILGSLMAMQVPFVGFNVIYQAECAASHGVFVALQVYMFGSWVRSFLPPKLFNSLFRMALFAVVGLVAGSLLLLQLTGKVQWTGRSLSLLDPTYAKKYIPIIASVSEHQPTTWTSFFFDLHILVPFSPVGLYFLFQRPTDASIFVILYGTIAWYFAGVMVRLMLTLAPIACILAAFGISKIIRVFSAHLIAADSVLADGGGADGAAATPAAATGGGKRGRQSAADAKSTPTPPTDEVVLPSALSGVVVLAVTILLSFYALHCTYVASEAYSSPSIVLANRRQDGTRVIFDDFREAYYWLRQNTEPDEKIMSWWDYGYQMSAMANRTVLVDNNTWNNTHIATVGRALASSEERAYPIIRSLDVDYVLVIFGGMTGYQSDDINKFLWFVRIGSGVYPEELQEEDYFSNTGFRVDNTGSDTLLNCVAYKMCYYRFGEGATDYGRPSGFDRVRNVEIGNKDFELTHFEEAFTSEHWLVRIFKVKKPNNFVPGTALTSDGYADFAPLSSPDSKAPVRRASTSVTEPQPVYVGCYSKEDDLGRDREYGGGSTGASLSLAKHWATAKGKRYVALARAGADGHAFAFNDLRSEGDMSGGGCDRTCVDDQSARCGCSDEACGVRAAAGENVRRWVVYALPKQGEEADKQDSAAAAADGGGEEKKKRRKKSKK